MMNNWREEPLLNEPFDYDEAMKAPDTDEWIKVIEFELNTLNKMHVWEVAQLSANINIIGSKWVYCYQYNQTKVPFSSSRVHTYIWSRL
jgi:hypothetical protein